MRALERQREAGDQRLLGIGQLLLGHRHVAHLADLVHQIGQRRSVTSERTSVDAVHGPTTRVAVKLL